MNSRLVLFKSMTVFVLLAIAGGAVGGMPVLAAQTGPESAFPAGLSADDWGQIQAILPAALPAQQAYLKASNTGAGDYFGYSVAVHGDTAVVGAYLEDSNATGVNGDQNNDSALGSGSVYIFTRSGGTWSQQAYLKATNTGADDQFGVSVALDSDTLVVGARYEDSNANGVDGDQSNNSATDSGAVYVFTRSGTTWSQQAYVKASNTGAGDYFGLSVAISGDTVVVGAPSEDSNATGVNGNQGDNSATNSGAAYVFTRSGGTWSQQAYLKASNTQSSDYFGYSVFISSDTVAAGAPYEDSNATGVNGNQSDNSFSSSGAAYVFTRSGTTWSQQAYLKASNTDADDFFGWSIAISGDTVVVGAYYEDSIATGVNGNESDNSTPNSGAAYVFVHSGGTWGQQAYLKASNTGAADNFGWSVAIFEDTLVVGAYHEYSNATGVNGNQGDNSATGAGAAYVFTRSGVTWSQQAYVKASNTAGGDNFGSSVAIYQDTLVVGAPYEDSNATGINGNQSDNTASNAGAVYAFVPPNSAPTDASLSNSSVAEDQPVGTTVGTLTTTDPDVWDTHTYSLACSAAGADDASFQISGESLQTKAVFDYETKNTYAICIQTEDNHGATFDKNFTITVTGVNEVPTDITLTNSSVAENQPTGTVVGTFTTTDPDSGDSHTYSFACSTPGVDDASFQISSDSLQTKAVFDYETKNSYAICIRTEDDHGATYDKNFAITVTVNEAPTDITLSNSSVVENLPVGTVVGTLTTTDPDSGDTHTYSFACSAAGADDASFQISGNSLKTKAVFDYETKNSYAICIRTEDDHGATFDKNFTINVTNVIESLTATFRSDGTKDGWILESNETSNKGGTLNATATTFNLGDEAGDKQYRAVLSFNTASLPDTAVITKVTLKIKKMGLAGTNPFTILGSLKIDIRKPYFGTTVNLVASDFQAAVSKAAAGSFSKTPVSNWYSSVLTSLSYPYINKTGTTQFRLYFTKDDNDDGAADFMKFFSGNYATVTARPMLVIEYHLP